MHKIVKLITLYKNLVSGGFIGSSKNSSKFDYFLDFSVKVFLFATLLDTTPSSPPPLDRVSGYDPVL